MSRACNIALRGVFVYFLLVITTKSFAIVIHNDNQPSDRPSNNVIGRWNTNASCVAVSPNYVVTTRHQGGGVDSTIQIGGVNYKAAQIWDIGSADLRVVRLVTVAGLNPNLATYAGLYSNSNEVFQDITIGGYGKGRGTALIKDSIVYGYQWDNNSNTVLRWCTNIVGGTYVTPPDTYISEAIWCDFDGLGEGGATMYEGIIAEFDSGGGMFIETGNQWKVAGLNRGVEHDGESWFLDPNSTPGLDPNDADGFDGVRISPYYSDINPKIFNTHIISGHILDNNKPSEVVKLQADSGKVYTNTNSAGYYELWVPDGWTGTVVPTKSYYTFIPASRSYSNVTADTANQDYQVSIVLLDDFDNNQRDATWKYGTEDVNLVWLNEVNQRLELRAVNGVNEVEAVYAANRWKINTSSDFAFKVDLNHQLMSIQDSWLFLRLKPTSDANDFISFEAGCANNQKYWFYEEVADGNTLSSLSASRSTNSGKFYISYSAGSDALYLSYTGYGSTNAWRTITGALHTRWGSSPIYISIGGGSEAATVATGQIYLDDFEIHKGVLIDWPPVNDINGDGFIDWGDIKEFTDQWLQTGSSLSSDLNNDLKVDFKDFAGVAEAW